MIFKGNPVSEGAAVGSVYVYKPEEVLVKENFISKERTPAQIKRLSEACDLCRDELQSIVAGMDAERGKIFLAHIEILDDEVIFEEIEEEIASGPFEADYAVYKVFSLHADIISRAKDPIIRERAADLIDVRNRLIRKLRGQAEKNLSRLPGPVIVVANDLLPSDTATIDRENVLGIITERGGATSHTAIIAKTFSIPAILGMGDATAILKDGELIAIDAGSGEIITGLSEEQKALYIKKCEEYKIKAMDTARYLDLKTGSKDGAEGQIGINIGSDDEKTLEMSRHADLVGLFRTEFLYMESKELPSEEAQFGAYKRTLLALGDKPVMLRTLDIGGDKTLPSLKLPKEENPFLGVRALRLCFARPDIFKTQLRAALRASVFGNLWIMFPMAGSLDDIRRAKKFVFETMEELSSEGIPYKKDIPLGVMIEIPSIALMADVVVNEVDFASIGTNDLCQYALAADRVNPGVGDYYQSFHPALFRLIDIAARAFTKANKPLGVCGEIGGNPLAAPVLFGLGVRELSMSPSSLAKVKKVISSLDMSQMENLAKQVLSLDTEKAVLDCLNKELSHII